MRRRDFLKSASATAAALASAGGPYFVNASDKAGLKRPVVGEGEHRYECHHGWGQLPPGFGWQTTHGVTVDADGFVYVKQQGLGGKPVEDTVLIFDPAGKFVRSFGKGYHPGGHGIDIRKEGSEQFLYLCDIHHGLVIKTNLKGEEVWRKGAPGEPGVYGKGKAYRPTNVAFAQDGGFYVADGYGSNYVHQYDKDAKWVRTRGGTGKGPGRFQTPHGIWLDDRPGREPAVVVADRANHRLQYLTLNLEHKGFVTDVLFPAHFDIRGDVLLVPDLHARVSLFDRDNRPIVHLGDDPAWRKEVLDGFKVRRDESRWKPGKFVHPHDACFDKDGNIFIVEWVETGRVTLLKKVT